MRKYGKDCSFPQYPAFIQWKSCDFCSYAHKAEKEEVSANAAFIFSTFFTAFFKNRGKTLFHYPASVFIHIKKELFLKQLFLHGILEIRKLRKLLQADQLEGIHKFLRDLI